MLEKQAEAQKQYLEKQVEAAQPAYARAKKLAALLKDKDVDGILKSLAPSLSSDVIQGLKELNNV
jgi:hypothetical protein